MQVYQPTSSGVTRWISKDRLAVTRIRRSNLASTSPRCQVRLKRTVLATRHVKMTFALGDAVALEGTVIAGGGSAEIHRHKWVKNVRLYTRLSQSNWIQQPDLNLFTFTNCFFLSMSSHKVFGCLWTLQIYEVCAMQRETGRVLTDVWIRA